MIPTYEEIMLPLLKHLADGHVHSLKETHDALAVFFKLSDQEIRELLPSGSQPVFRNRVGWARTYMKKAGLIEAPKRAHFVITQRGIDLLKENPEQVDSNLLLRYKEFVEFREFRRDSQDQRHVEEISEEEKTPQEALEDAYKKLNAELATEVLDTVKSCSPDFFEGMVVDLLLKMGYGGSKLDAGRAIGKTGDGGVDGIIKEDKLGLDVIYMQAKRWENSVPVKEIRDFYGALASKKARKGVFITTSSFPKSVFDFVNQVEYKIILIDGHQLANLMIEYNVGLTTTNTFHVKAIDSDYFEEN